jgi:hypothetical protein
MNILKEVVYMILIDYFEEKYIGNLVTLLDA